MLLDEIFNPLHKKKDPLSNWLNVDEAMAKWLHLRIEKVDEVSVRSYIVKLLVVSIVNYCLIKKRQMKYGGTELSYLILTFPLADPHSSLAFPKFPANRERKMTWTWQKAWCKTPLIHLTVFANILLGHFYYLSDGMRTLNLRSWEHRAIKWQLKNHAI